MKRLAPSGPKKKKFISLFFLKQEKEENLLFVVLQLSQDWEAL